MRRNRCEKVEEIEDNFGASITVDADWDESRKSIAGPIRIYDLFSGFVFHQIVVDARTLFANLEQLISFPSNDTARQSAPTPFQNTAKNLRRELVTALFLSPRYSSYHRLIEPQLLHQGISADRGTLLEGLIEVISDECTGRTRVGTGTEGEEQEWGVES